MLAERLLRKGDMACDCIAWLGQGPMCEQVATSCRGLVCCRLAVQTRHLFGSTTDLGFRQHVLAFDDPFWLSTTGFDFRQPILAFGNPYTCSPWGE